MVHLDHRSRLGQEAHWASFASPFLFASQYCPVMNVAGPSRISALSLHAGPSGETEEARMSNLIAQLTLEDIHELESNSTRKGKGREGAPQSDAELAFDLFASEIKSHMIIQSDRDLAARLQAEVEVLAPRPTPALNRLQPPPRPTIATTNAR